MSKVQVISASRDRPEWLKRMLDSVAETSDATCAVWVDADQAERYRGPPVTIGPQIGVVAAINELVRRNPADIYVFLTDDMIVTTPGWDRWLASMINGKPAIVGAAHNYGPHFDVPAVSYEWVRRLGWFAYPKCWHYSWVSMLQVLGECAQMIHYATPEQWRIQHDQVATTPIWSRDRDAMDLQNFMIQEFRDCLGKLRA